MRQCPHMALMVSGLVVTHSRVMRGAGDGVLAMMEPTQPPNSLEQKKQLKNEIKRDKNRESSARSRERKKNEDEDNEKAIVRLEQANEELRRREEMLLREGREILQQVYPYYYSNPRCPGCPEESAESEPSDAVPLAPHLSAPQPTDFMDQS